MDVRSKLATLVAVILAIGLLAAGCGDSDGESEAEVGTTTDGGEPAGATGEGSAEEGEPTPKRGPEAEVDRAVRAFLRAALSGDGEGACELLSEDGRASVEASLPPTADGPVDCAETFELIAGASGQTIRLGEEDVTADDVDSLELSVEIASDGRSADVFAKAHRQPATLVRERGEWKLNWD
ncbi:MAG TPA: hypothetical protein VK919_08365 [Solirubrobacterales bacterium]|nr:hypothetical protein [Solirubrobacterales bacterium]